MQQEEINIPIDIRGKKKKGRPTNDQRSQPSSIQESARELTADIIYQLKKNVKNLDPSTQVTLLGKLLPLIINSQTQSQEDVTMEVLCRKALQVDLRISQVNKKASGKE